MQKFLALAALFAVTTSTYAVIRPGWERPIAKATMTEVGAKPGTPNAVYELTMNKKDTLKGYPTKPTSLTLTTESVIMCVVAPCPRPKTSVNFTIRAIEKDGCNSTIYRASENVSHSEPAMIELVDHGTRLCEDYRPYRWEMKLMGFRFLRNFVGNPKSVITIQ